MPGLRGMPDVMTTTSELALSAKSLVPTPITRAAEPSIGHDSINVERDAGRFRVGNVNDNHVGELFLRDRTRYRRANIARSADHRHFPIHAALLSERL